MNDAIGRTTAELAAPGRRDDSVRSCRSTACCRARTEQLGGLDAAATPSPGSGARWRSSIRARPVSPRSGDGPTPPSPGAQARATVRRSPTSPR